MDVSVDGRDLGLLARRLEYAGRQDLRKELLAGIRSTNKATIAAMRDKARGSLPSRGGLAEIVASSSIGTRTRLTPGRIGVRIKGTGKVSISSINAGHLRHPVFGNRNNFVEQAVEPGWFDEPVVDDLPRIKAGIEDAMKRVRDKIERGL